MPQQRHDMDQVPLPFVVSMESIYAMGNDDDVHVSCLNEALRKKQFAVYIFVTPGGRGT